jgi:hypothetical protein
MPFELPAGYEEVEPIPLAEQQENAQQPKASLETSSEEPEEEQESEQLGPFAPVEIDNPIGQFMEDASVAILDAFSDQDADEIREERATKRAVAGEKGKALEEQMSQDTSVGGELIRAGLGSVEDFAEGVVNLPGDLLSVLPQVDDDFLNVDFNFIRENNTEWGKAVRTLGRYVISSRQLGRIGPFAKLGTGKTALGLAGGRAATGFVEDFIGSDGTGEDSTLVGSTPWTAMFQTSDDNNPIHNRTLNGLEGALFEVVGGKAIDAVRDLKLWSKFRSSPVGRKYFPGVKQDPKAAQKALEARGRLNNLLAKTYAEDQFGKTLNYTLKVQQDFALRALEDARQPLNNLIEQAAQGDNGIVQYLQARTRALGAANLIDKTYNTVKFGGDPDEQVIDGLSWPGIQRQMEQIDRNIADAQQMSSDLDLRVEELSENLTQQSALSGRRAADIEDLQVRSLDAPRQADLEASQTMALNLSAYQVKYLKDNKLLPRGITITAGRRVKGLTSGNIDELIQAIQEGPDTTVKQNLLKRLPNIERPAPIDESIDTVEGLNKQVEGLKAEAKAADEAAALQRQELEPLFQEQTLARQMLKQLELEREAMYARFNGQDVEFKAKAEEIKAKNDPDIPPEKVDEIVQKAEVIQPTTRKQAMEAGKESDQLIPTKARAPLGSNPPRTESNVGTARPTPSSLTEANIRSMARDDKEFITLKNIAGMAEKIPGRTESEVIEAMQSQVTDDLVGEIKRLTGDDLDQALRTNPQFGTMLNDGRFFITSIEGREAMNRVVREMQVEIKELSQTISSQVKEGAPEAVMNMERLNERFLTLFNFIKSDDAAKGSMLNELKYIAENTGSKVKGQNSELLDELIARNNDILARQELTYKRLLAIGDMIRTDPKAAGKALSRAIDTLAYSHNISVNQLDVIKALTSSNIKNADGFYINSILSGPATQARNFWGNFYQSTGHPLLALLGTHFSGKSKELVRRQAVAALGATYETYMEMTDLLPRIWNNNVKGLDFDSPNYQVWDEELTKKMAKIEEMRDSGQLNWMEETMLSTAINMRKILLSPFFSPMMRAMGTVDSFFKVIAGRQMISRRAVEDAMATLGDRPLTAKSSEEFAELVQQYKAKHELDVFAEDKLTLIDPEAEELSRVFTFQQSIQDSDILTKSLNTLASVPGGRLLGLTFVKTPSMILKGALGLTPGLSTIMKKRSQAYKNGSAYYRAMRDGQEAMSYVIGASATTMGAAGVLTGAGPLNAEDNKKWRLAGNKPFTLKLPFGGEVNYQGLEPATTIIGLFADIGALGVEGELGLETAAAAVGSNIINKSFLAQVASAAEILTTQGGGLKDVGANVARGIVPFSGLRSQVGQLIDPYIREHRSAIEPTWSWFLKKNGGFGLSATLPSRPDPLTGEALTRDGYGVGGGNLLALFNMASPLGLRFSQNRTDPVHKKLFDAGVNIDEEMRTMDDVDLTNKEMVEYELIKAGNGNLRKDLLDYFNSDQYKLVDKPNSDQRIESGQEESDTPVYKALMNIIGAYGKAAKNVMRLGQTTTSRAFQQRLDEALQGKIKLDKDFVRRQDALRFPTE